MTVSTPINSLLPLPTSSHSYCYMPDNPVILFHFSNEQFFLRFSDIDWSGSFWNIISTRSYSVCEEVFPDFITIILNWNFPQLCPLSFSMALYAFTHPHWSKQFTLWINIRLFSFLFQEREMVYFRIDLSLPVGRWAWDGNHADLKFSNQNVAQFFQSCFRRIILQKMKGMKDQRSHNCKQISWILNAVLLMQWNNRWAIYSSRQLA